MNYYEILGLERSCNIEDIKKSYKTLSLKYHPDHNDGDSKQFLEIKKAYDYLIDNHGKNKLDDGYNKMFSEIFSSMRDKRRPKKSIITVAISLEEAIKGFERSLKVNLDIPCQKCSTITQSNCKHCSGFGVTKIIKQLLFKQKKVDFNEQEFIIENFYQNNNLHISVQISDTEKFKIRKKTVESAESINIFKSMLGGPHTVETAYGTEKIDLPGNMVKNFIYKIENKGLGGGHHLINFKVISCKNLTNIQKEHLNCILDEELKKNNT